ncbi:MAG TPA: alanine racemase, partial [Solirubrobacteraceae bacterium]|nr:alanine racemase [Solirubrobacteraceae bacterium]
MTLRAVAEVNLAAIERNAATIISRLSPGTRLCAVVKADAYGHGAIPAAGAALRGGATELAVATAQEAAEIMRELGRPALVLGAISQEELPIAVREGRATVTAWDLGFVASLAREAERSGPIDVHVKLDTGLGRLGTRVADQALAVAEAVEAAPGLRLT